jgi:hypothetical protein
MNSPIVKMFGPSISDPTRIVNRDVPACDEQAYKATGYKRGSISEEPTVAEALKQEVEKPSLGSEELPMEDLNPVVETEPPTDKPAKPRKKKVQN